MISTIIVDDEYLIRSLIRNSVDWAQYGMEVVGEAGDGEEALEMIQRLRPQVALVDINMPLLNGLELAQRLRQQDDRIRIVFLTGYREFEYAKEAVACRAFGYLLKPISVEEIAAVLTRLRVEIEAEQTRSAYLQTVEKQGDQGKRLLQENFLHRLAFGSFRMTGAQMAAELRRMDIRLEPRNILALVVQLEYRDAEMDDGLYTYAVVNMLCELLEEDGNFFDLQGITEIDSCAVVLCNVRTVGGAAMRLRQVWRKLTDTVTAYFPFSVCGGVSGVFHEYERISGAVKDAMEVLDGKFYQPESGIFFAGDRTGHAGATGLGMLNFEELQLCVDSGEREAGAKCIRSLFCRMRLERVPVATCRMTALGIAAIFYSLSAKYGLPPEIMLSDGETVSAGIDAGGTCDEVERVLLRCYDRLMDGLKENRKVSRLAQAVQEYIREHYQSGDLSLKTIAGAVFATPAYVSSLFKKEMGMSVTEYITICRMKRAAELLNQNHDLGLTAISEQVGYTDPYYFSRCFKKYYGVTPSKFLTNRAGEKPREP